MTDQCVRCGGDIEADDVRYEEHDASGDTELYCSVGCVADVDGVDEERARRRIFADPVQA